MSTKHFYGYGVIFGREDPCRSHSVQVDAVIAIVARGHVIENQAPIGHVLHALAEGGQREEGAVRKHGDHLLGLTPVIQNI